MLHSLTRFWRWVTGRQPTLFQKTLAVHIAHADRPSIYRE